MILDVTAKTAILQQNSMKRKNEEEKLTKEKLAILRKQKEIEGLEHKLAERQASLSSEEEDLKRHKIFTNFLQAVIIDKSGDNETFSGLEDLQNRFTSLKGENEHLRRRVSSILLCSLTTTFVCRKKKSTEKRMKRGPRRGGGSTTSRPASTSSSGKCRPSKASWRCSPPETLCSSRSLRMRSTKRTKTRPRSGKSSTPSTTYSIFAWSSRKRGGRSLASRTLKSTRALRTSSRPS